jgi:hypothetical protein
LQNARLRVTVLLYAHRLEGISLNENTWGYEATWIAIVMILQSALISKLTNRQKWQTLFYHRQIS